MRPRKVEEPREQEHRDRHRAILAARVLRPADLQLGEVRRDVRPARSPDCRPFGAGRNREADEREERVPLLLAGRLVNDGRLRRATRDRRNRHAELARELVAKLAVRTTRAQLGDLLRRQVPASEPGAAAQGAVEQEELLRSHPPGARLVRRLRAGGWERREARECPSRARAGTRTGTCCARSSGARPRTSAVTAQCPQRGRGLGRYSSTALRCRGRPRETAIDTPLGGA